MGIAEINLENGTLFLWANIILYGNKATEELATLVAKDIEETWNEAKASVRIKKHVLEVVFRMNGINDPHLRPDDIFENTDPLNNYFRVEEKAYGNISFVDGIGSNTGYFQLDNLLNQSTTAAHEYGHTIGLEHPINLDIRGEGIPGIMYPRGTIVDPAFQYDPSIPAGHKGGTMNPYHRKVKQQDVDLLRLSSLPYNKNGRAIVGDFSSVWHEAFFA